MSKMNKYPSPVGSRFKRLNPVFHIQSREADSKELSSHLVKLARKSGQLNLSGRGLAFVPEKVWKLDDLEESEVRLLEVKLDTDADCDKWWEHEPLNALDLSSNSLSQVSSNIKNLYSLKSLNIHDNNLDTLPDELGSLTKLTRLLVSHNKLCQLPESLYQLPELRMLVASHNQLEVVGEAMSDLVMLEHLDLSHNCIAALPPGIGFLIRLTQLDLSHNTLSKVPPDLVNLRVLLNLNMSHNKLDELPPLGELRRLELLYLEHNLLTEVPDMTGCEALKEVHLADNCIKVVKLEHVEMLGHLRVLNLRENKLTELPDGLACLQNLVRLDLTNNYLVGLPNTLGLLPHLQSLQVEGNPLRTIRRDMVQTGTVRLLRFLRQKLEADAEAGAEILGVPGSTTCSGVNFPDRYMMRNGRALNLAMQNLNDVPVEVFQEAREAEVITIDLSKNRLVQVPCGLEKLLGQLTDLNLSCNMLKNVPSSLGVCLKLQYLDLQKNDLSDLPKELGALYMLRELNIAYNKFSQLPACVFELVGVEILVARDNQMSSICVEGLSHLSRLIVLDLSNNSISHVPPELGTMSQLRSLELAGNCFRQPRHAILAKGTQEVLSYLRDRMPEQRQA